MIVGTVQVAFAPSLTVEILPGALRQFQAEAPEVEVASARPLQRRDVAGAAGRQDRCGSDDSPRPDRLAPVSFEPLHEYALCLAVHPAHPLARVRKVKTQTLLSERLLGYSKSEYPEYHERLRDLFKPFGQPQIVYRRARQFDQFDRGRRSRARGGAGAGIPRLFDGATAEAARLIPAPPPLPVGVARKKGTRSDLVNRFIAAARRCRRSKSNDL